MRSKKFFSIVILVAVLSVVLTHLLLSFAKLFQNQEQTENVSIKQVESVIKADGIIHSRQEAILHFLSGGKVTYFPFKEGDKLYSGQVIATLDERAVLKTLQSSLLDYSKQRNTFDQTGANNGGYTNPNNAINDSVKRVLQNNQYDLDKTVISVELQDLAKQQAELVSPIDGILLSSDIKLPNVSITTTTSFSVADPTQPVFKAFILPQDIDFIEVGSKAVVTIDSAQGIKFEGVVEKIYPQKVQENGTSGYYVDISSDNLKNISKLGQTGTVLIESTARGITQLIPQWVVVGHEYVWVLENKKPVLKKIKTGKIHGDMIEIYPLPEGDKIITNPKGIIGRNYILL